MGGSKLTIMSIAAMLVGLVAWAVPFNVFAAFPADTATFGPGTPSTIFTQVAYSDEDGMLIVYHVLRPPPFFTSDETGIVYRFRDDATGEGCPALRPVFEDGTTLRDDTPAFAQLGEGLSEADRARRSITDVFFKNGCPTKKTQPKSEDEVLALEAAGEVELQPDVDFVNAASVPSPKLMADWELWEAPPGGANIFDGSLSAQSNAANVEIQDIVLPVMARPRHKGFSGGKSMWYITYEICSDETWSDTGFCSGDGVKDIFLVRYGSSHTKIMQTNIAFGVPFPKAEIAKGNTPKSGGNYSPMWRGACVGGQWVEDRGFEGTDAGDGPGGMNCFGPTSEEVKDFTSANNILLSGDQELIDNDPDDPRIGGQMRTSPDFLLLDGMNGFDPETTPTKGKVKIINCPIFASDLNNDRKFSADEIIAFPNHVLEADRNGNFNVFTKGGKARDGNP